MLPAPTTTNREDKQAEYRYEGTTREAIVEGVKAYFEARKYKLENGKPDNGTYGIGSDLMRILFGAFAKRYSFTVQIGEEDGVVVFKLTKAMSGAMGGVIGHSKMTKEYKTIADEFAAGVS